MADRDLKPRPAVPSMEDTQGRERQEGASETALHSSLYSTPGSHPFFDFSFLSEIVIREIERRNALSTGHSQTRRRLCSVGCGNPLCSCKDADCPLSRRRVTEAFFAISVETEQPYRITEDCYLWAAVPETEENVPVSVFLDETHELLADKSTFFASTKPFPSNSPCFVRCEI